MRFLSLRWAAGQASHRHHPLRQGEARLQVFDVEHHPGEPHQQANHAGHRGDAARSAEEQFQQADFFHGRQRSPAHYGWRGVRLRHHSADGRCAPCSCGDGSLTIEWRDGLAMT